jgi:phosphoadenosine phosphosulfate reductase
VKRKKIHDILDTKEKERMSIQRCIEFQNKDENRTTILAFSGGKDSVVAYMMAAKSGIKFIPMYSPTSVDPPELINYIKKEFNPWVRSKGYPEVVFKKYNTFSSKRVKGKMTGKPITMWSLIANRAMPPTRMARYCCDELKERTGEVGDTVFTGVRWEESKTRSQQQMVSFYKGKIMVRPIVDWTEYEVWSYILENEIPYCKLYDQGWDRIGCIGCPLGKGQKKELQLYPKFKAAYIRAFEKMIQYRKDNGMECEWKTGEEVMKWWTGDVKKKEKEIDGQCSMF